MCWLSSSAAPPDLLLEIAFTLALLLVRHVWVCFFAILFFFNRHFVRVLTIETRCFLEEISCQSGFCNDSGALSSSENPLKENCSVSKIMNEVHEAVSVTQGVSTPLRPHHYS